MNALRRNRTHVVLAFLLFVLFLGPAGYKIFALKYPLSSAPIKNLWTLEFKIEFQGSGQKDTIHHFLPKNDLGQSVVREDFISQDLYFVIQKEDGNIGIKWKGEHLTGEVQLFYRATVQTEPRTVVLLPGTGPETYPAQVFQYLLPQDQLESVDAQMYDILHTILAGVTTKEEMARKLFSFLVDDVTTLALSKHQNLVGLLLSREATLAQKNQLFLRLARMAEIPARSVHGIVLEEGIRQKAIHSWAEVYLQGKWVPVNLETRSFAELPENLLILYRGEEPFMSSSSVKGLTYHYAISKELRGTYSHFYETSEMIGSFFHEWSLFILPVETRQVFRLILMIPLGALVVSVFRNVIGINTFGTFMPVLIALAFRNTRLGWGLVLFSLVIVLGLISRWYMDRLKLLLVPRLSVIVTVVIMILVVGSVVGQHLGIYRIMAVALFPMVIMTMTIERLSIMLMERGAREALKVSLGTLVVATCSYCVMSIDALQNFFFAFPEVLFALIAIQILLGRYTGYRLTEYFRFLSFIQGSGNDRF